MLQGLFNRAEMAIDSVIAKHVGRATVAVPLVVAAGFATAALTVKLVELYGAVTGYALMAALFAVVGMLTAAVIGLGSRAAEAPAEGEPSAEAQEAAKEVESLLTPELTTLLSTAAPIALPAVVRGLIRNLPLVLLLAVAAYLFSRLSGTSDTVASGSAEAPVAPPA